MFEQDKEGHQGEITSHPSFISAVYASRRKSIRPDCASEPAGCTGIARGESGTLHAHRGRHGADGGALGGTAGAKESAVAAQVARAAVYRCAAGDGDDWRGRDVYGPA